MSDLGSILPVPVQQTLETKEMKLKWLQSAKQERISKIVHLKQAIEDLVKGKIPEIERQILQATQELANLEYSEKIVTESVEISVIREK
jgi:hypothetical protein